MAQGRRGSNSLFRTGQRKVPNSPAVSLFGALVANGASRISILLLMTATANRTERTSRTFPRSADFRLLIVGTVGLLVALFADPVPRRVAPSPLVYSVGMLVVTVVLAAVVALPAFLLRGRRGDWRGFTVWLGKGLLILTSLVLVGHVRRAMSDSPPTLVESLKAGRLSIERFLRAERAAAPAMFDRRFLMGHESALRASLPGLSNVALAEVTDSDAWMRAHLTYAALPEAQEKSVRTTGHIVIYYHPAGMAVLGAVCSAADNACKPLAGLLTAAEQALRARLDSSDLEGVLPESKACSTEAVQLRNTDHQSEVRVCAYGSDLQLTLTRLGSGATIESLVAERTASR